MLDNAVQLLETYEPTISAIVGIVTLCAAVAGLFRFGLLNRKVNEVPSSEGTVRHPRFKALFDIGLSQHSRLEELVAIRTVNIMLFCLMAISFPWLCASIFVMHTAFLSLINMLVFVSVLVGLALQHSGSSTAARWLVIFATQTYWLGILLAVGPFEGTEYFLAALVALPVLIFSRAQTGQRLLCIVLLITVFGFGAYVTQFAQPIQPLSPEINAIGYYINALLLAATIVAAVSYYKGSAAKSYSLLAARKSENDNLVSRLFPADIANKIVNQETAEARWHPQGTVIYATVTGLSELYSVVPAIDLVDRLRELYARFDDTLEQLGVDKIKTLGATYVAASGLDPRQQNTEKFAECALEMRDIVDEFAQEQDLPLGFRCAIATGFTISGVIGKEQPRFDVWGESLDIATNLQSNTRAGDIVVNDAAYRRFEEDFTFEPNLRVPGAYFLEPLPSVPDE